MKSKSHVSLAHLHLLSPKSDTLLFFFSTNLKTSTLFCQTLIRNAIHLPGKIISFLLAQPDLFGKITSHLPARPVGKIISHLPVQIHADF